MNTFGRKSKENLITCHQDLQLICWEAIQVMDFSVTCGARGEEEQTKLFDAGKSKLEYPFSMHNKAPSRAVDLAPYPIDWNDTGRFKLLAGIIYGIAQCKGIKIRWGGNWSGDFDLKSNKFKDLPHFELV